MMRTRRTLNQIKPKWLGDRKKCSKPNPFTGTSTTYEGFEFNNIIAQVGDFVLISNADANEPDTVEGCDVARIEHLFESAITLGDKYRANVQWYSKPSTMPKSIDKDLMDERYEVFEDCRNYDRNVSIETIFKKCSVINAYEDDIPEEVYLNSRRHSSTVYVCRYRLCQKAAKYYIEPVLKLDEMLLNPDEEGSSYLKNNDVEKKSKFVPNFIVSENEENLSKRKNSRRSRPMKQKYEPPNLSSETSHASEDKTQNKTDYRLRSALRKCSIDSDSETSKGSSSNKHLLVLRQDSDFENTPESTPRKNPPRSSRRNGTPLKSNRINTTGLESNDQSQSLSRNPKKKVSSNTGQMVNTMLAKEEVNSPIRKRKASRSSSEESLEPRSPSMSPKINYCGPPAVYRLYETKGQTFILKKPIDIVRKISKKLDDSAIVNLLSSDESDSETIFENLERSGTKVVARSRSGDTGFELLSTPNKNGELSEKITESHELQTPKSARRNLLQTLDIEDTRDVNRDLLLKKLADKREDVSLRIKLRRSSEQSNYKIDSDSDCNVNNKFRRRTALGTQKNMIKVNSKTPGTPTVRFSNQNNIVNENASTTELSEKLRKVEIKLKRVEPEEVRQSPRNRKLNPKYLDHYEVVQSPITNNETPNKRIRKSVNYNANSDCEGTSRKTRYSMINNAKDCIPPSNKQSNKSNNRMNETEFEDVEQSRTPRKSRRTMNTEDISTPSRRVLNSKEIEPVTPKRNVNTPKLQTPSRSVKTDLLTPSMRHRKIRAAVPSTPLQEARARLHVSAVPKSLPCREKEFNNIYTFLEGKLEDKTGGCLYISGVPGTGKTATVNEVIRCLKKTVSKQKIDNFDFIQINAMKLTEPRQAYVEILKQLTGKKTTWEQAHQLLDKRFTTPAPRRLMTLLVVDELDILCNKRQDVIYNLLDWPAKSSAQLVVITIANTMDLPERILMGRVTSRLGLTRLTFQPYTHKQLQEIVTTRLNESHAFKSEAIQLVSRKVAAVSGDARRALDICRRATEVAEMNNSEVVTMQDVNEALTEMIASVKVQAIRHCSEMEQTFLRAVCAEVARTGVEEVIFKNIYSQLLSLCLLEGLEELSVTEAATICAKLGAYRLLICEHSRADIHQRVLLNVSSDDVHFALQDIEV